MTTRDPQQAGRLRKAPEHFIDAAGVKQVFEEARQGRRGFIRQAFAAAVAGAAAPAGAGSRMSFVPPTWNSVPGRSATLPWTTWPATSEPCCDLLRSIHWPPSKTMSAWTRESVGSSGKEKLASAPRPTTNG